MIKEILQELKVFDSTTLPWVFMILMAVGFITYIIKNNNFKHATNKMKEMSNDNMHGLAQEMKDEVKAMNGRFSSLETLLKDEIIYGNRMLVSGLRDEIKIGLDGARKEIASGLNGGLTKQKIEMDIATKEMVKSARAFRGLCNKCQYGKK